MMFVRFLVPAVAVLAVLGLSAGRLDHWTFWAYAGTIYLAGSTTYTYLARVHPGLVAERFKPPSDRDRATRRMVLPVTLVHLVAGGLDARYGWSSVAPAVSAAGLVVFASAFLLVAWTLASNPYASSAVRVQHDRDQQVVSHGPYGIVRHPMYLAVLIVCLGAGPALGSWYAGLALLPLVPIFVRRTLVEDAMLHRELAGYAAYARRVRWRIVPGVF